MSDYDYSSIVSLVNLRERLVKFAVIGYDLFFNFFFFLGVYQRVCINIIITFACKCNNALQ